MTFIVGHKKMLGSEEEREIKLIFLCEETKFQILVKTQEL